MTKSWIPPRSQYGVSFPNASVALLPSHSLLSKWRRFYNMLGVWNSWQGWWGKESCTQSICPGLKPLFAMLSHNPAKCVGVSFLLLSCGLGRWTQVVRFVSKHLLLLSILLALCIILNLFLFYFILLYECLACRYVCLPHSCISHGGQKRAINPLELELWTSMSFYVDAVN